jgi:colanic acid/amylovoran biosynthesis protein
VPSKKLLTETSQEVQTAYLPFLVACSEFLHAKGCAVRLLLHERDDEEVLQALAARLSFSAPILRHENSLHLKGVIGQAELVVGSRFHALVSALTQGVPAVGIGWSHKYEMLFGDYGCAELVIPPTLDDDGLRSVLQPLVDDASALRSQLRVAAEQQKAATRAMWGEVRSALGLASTPAG